ncbi:MAG TPA: D-xylose transporter XylE [Sphingomonas sp.]|uniref:D-xylose transporter XylE n=1 Tax=Sphingomonas sp. TaxID=28214 RepID=UPI002EDA034F
MSTRTDHNQALLTRLTITAALGGLLFGYDTAVISGAVGAIKANFIAPRGLSEVAASGLAGWTISCALLGCAVGAGIAGSLSNRIGRRGGMLVAAVLFILSAVGSAFPEFGHGVVGGMGPAALPWFIFYRLIGGVGIGLASVLSPLYIAEIAPADVRGRMVTYQQVAIVSGITLVYFVNWAIAAQGDEVWVLAEGWRYMLLSGVIPAALFFVLLFGVPDSPRWLVLKNRAEEARAVLTRLTTASEADVILREIEGTLVEKTRPLGSYGWTVIGVGLALSIFQQFVGINAVLYYAPQMFQNTGVSGNVALLQTIVVGLVMTVFTLVALVTVDNWGRKPLLMIGAVGMAVSMLALGLLFASGSVGQWALVAVMVYIAAFSLSWGPVVWVMLAEIFPNAIKGKAMAIAVAAQWISNLFVSATFEVMDGSTALNAWLNHGFAYFVYAGMSVLAAIFVWRFVPETKGRTLEAMEQLWQHR